MTDLTTASARCLLLACLLLTASGAAASPSGVDLGICRQAADRVAGNCAQRQDNAGACDTESRRAFEACREHLLAPFSRDRDREARAAAKADESHARASGEASAQTPAQPAPPAPSAADSSAHASVVQGTSD